MGVPLLWGEIGEAAQYNTLLGLSMEAFTKQPRVRAVRLGCDASIWLFVGLNRLQEHCRTLTLLLHSTLARWKRQARK